MHGCCMIDRQQLSSSLGEMLHSDLGAIVVDLNAC